VVTVRAALNAVGGRNAVGRLGLRVVTVVGWPQVTQARWVMADRRGAGHGAALGCVVGGRACDRRGRREGRRSTHRPAALPCGDACSRMGSGNGVRGMGRFDRAEENLSRLEANPDPGLHQAAVVVASWLRGYS
jgi:hypothetical protein